MQLRFRRVISALMALALLASTPALALGFIFGEGTNTPAASAIEDDGMLRVYLKSLGDPASLGMTLAGSYTVEGDRGFRFERDTAIVLAADGESVLLSVGGLTIDMGPSMTLTRQAVTDGGENGIYIHESEKDALFEGDLHVSVEDGGLRCILTIHIEDYLKGVVAYEMSDSFPLEALKAQAVAARTYAMGRKWVSATRDYDVVDTTQDQVYKGLDADYVNVIAAVEATRGVVGTYNGGFAMCYYTASNGGQTALATDIWGGEGDYGYLAMVDDPYDLENPASLVNSVTFASDASDNAALKAMLDEGIAALGLRFVKTSSMAVRARRIILAAGVAALAALLICAIPVWLDGVQIISAGSWYRAIQPVSAVPQLFILPGLLLGYAAKRKSPSEQQHR